MEPEFAVVISTYNRQASLIEAIESILAQESPPRFELIVVDNNSTDSTAAVLAGYSRAHANFRSVFEPRQGVSYGRNAGIAACAAPVIAFTDDDVIVSPDWLHSIANSLEQHPFAGCVGGKVLPRWPSSPPAWLTRNHWAPLALVDYGEAQQMDAQHRKCLITANMAVRRSVFEQIGGFVPAFQKTAGSTCSIEDRELQERYWNAGGKCWFDPTIVVEAAIQPNRLTKAYHRHWHFRHGVLNALLRDPEFEGSALRALDLPGHVVRRLVLESAETIVAALRGRTDHAFDHEVNARFYAGFIKQRLSRN